MNFNLKPYAHHFYSLGLNVTCIGNYRNEANITDNNLLKCPNHHWMHFIKDRQNADILNDYDWNNATGLGLVLGYDNLMAIDIDGCIDYDFVKLLCKELRLPESYEWIIQSGSGSGFHIILRCCDNPIKEEEIEKEIENSRWEYVEDFGYGNVNAYYPKKEYSYCQYENEPLYKPDRLKPYFPESFLIEDIFQKIEFRWKGHLVLPPSIHTSGLAYKFKNGVPKYKPRAIGFTELQQIYQKYCFRKAECSGCDDIKRREAMTDEVSYEKTFLNQHRFLVFDVETNGLPVNFKLPFTVSNNWPQLLQISWVIVDQFNNVIKRQNFIIKPVGFDLIQEGVLKHGISLDLAVTLGSDLKEVLNTFLIDVHSSDTVVCHNYEFDSNVILSELLKVGGNPAIFAEKPHICTMKSSTDFCGIQNSFGNKFPSLNELYFTLFKKHLFSIHNSIFDVTATTFCFNKLRRINAFVIPETLKAMI